MNSSGYFCTCLSWNVKILTLRNHVPWQIQLSTWVKACVKYCNIYIYILITTDNITILYTCTYNIHVVYIYIFMYVYTIINHKNICTVYACKWPHAVGPPCVGCNVARRQRTSCPTWAKQKSLWWLVPWNLEAHLRMMPQSRPNFCMFDMLWRCAGIQMKTNKTCRCHLCM